MKLVLTVFVVLNFFLSCSDATEKKSGKWRVIDTYEYNLDVDAQAVFTDIEETEKVLLMPVTYLEQKQKAVFFEQEITYRFDKDEDGKTASYSMNEKTTGYSDGTGAFHVVYGNNKNEGWEIVWKDNFLYRKLLGGEFARTFSMGEHEFFRETQFKMIPDMYTIFREHAKILGSKKDSIDGTQCRNLSIQFSSQKMNRAALPTKKYLQNRAGVDEHKNDKLIKLLASKGFANLSGELSLCIADDFTPLSMQFHLTVLFPLEKTTIIIDGTRVVRKKFTEKIVIPKYSPEYHRRTMDATKNIMK